MAEIYDPSIGADAARAFFSRSRKGEIAHGYLFIGPSGTGKKSFARYLAQSLLCEGNGDNAFGACGSCRSCALFGHEGQSAHPDFIEHFGALKIGDTASVGFATTGDTTSRDLIRQLAMQSYSGGRRVLLLADVEFASPAAANALLKFFEEPPVGVTLLLTSSTPAAILGTIRSRLTQLRIGPLSRDEMLTLLVRRGFASDAAERVLARARGSLTRALELLDIDAEAPHAVIARWFDDAIVGNTPAANWATRESLDEGLLAIKARLKDAIAAPFLGERPEGHIDLARGLKAFEKIDDAQRLARTNVSPTMVADLVRMAITGLALDGTEKS
ncbi:MAG: hypothetical protein HKL91_01935 [Candidatus Eremiobacteraeota bacterium]|uniref:Putative DNA polymerase III, delta prime subunit n=1 Tax=mine drainage metagenome TaxID=410659 RepID=E6PHC6_9ZZZZ|nr:hypothetical protein [Candidatus Eremiobacteraeota bacterium]